MSYRPVCFWALALVLAMASGWPRPACGAPGQPPRADRPEIQLTLDEAAAQRWLDLFMPQTVTVGNSMLGADLILTEPRDLLLKDGSASLKIRVVGKTLPIDQQLSAVVRIEYDPRLRQYFAIVSSLPVAIPGLGRVDIRDYLPRLAVPSVLRDLWRFNDKALGLSLRIRRIAILDHVVEVGADADFAPIARGSRAGAR